MRRFIIFLLTITILFSCASAEEEKPAEDYGREIFKSLTQEYDYSLNYCKKYCKLSEEVSEK